MENCDACESVGIQTVLIDNEWLGVDGSSESPLIAFSGRADAMASVGNIEEMLDLAPLDNIIGGHHLDDNIGDLREPMKLQVWSVVGAINQLGLTYLGTEAR